MFDTCVLDDEEVVAEKEISIDDLVTTVTEVVTIAGVKIAKPMVSKPSVSVSAAIISPKVSAVSTTSTTVTTTTKAKGIVM
nr:hypothetical protein [Tanacetum cinerariifolium]